MSRLINTVTTTTMLDHHLFQVADDDYGDPLASPRAEGGWVAAGRGSIVVETPYDNLEAILRLEEWDGEPDDDREPWDDRQVLSIECHGRNGPLGINQITMGWDDSGFSLSRPGRFRVRVSCRNGAAAWEAYLGVLERHGHELTPACDRELAELTVKEEYLMQFWPHEPDADHPELRLG